MPQISTQVTDLKSTGAVLQVFIFPPASQWWKPGLDPKDIPIFTATALIDTGASISAIDHSVAVYLNLISRDIIPILTPSGISNHPTFDIQLMLPNILGHKSFDLEVTGSDLIRQGFQVLIGRDVLQSCNFTFDGPTNSWQLSV